MTQLSILFPPPMTAQQLAASAELARIVGEKAESYPIRRFRERRAAGKLGWARRGR